MTVISIGKQTLIVPIPYREFGRQWERAFVGGTYRYWLIRFHNLFGVRIRRRVKFLRVSCWDGKQWRELWLNPHQIVCARAYET